MGLNRNTYFLMMELNPRDVLFSHQNYRNFLRKILDERIKNNSAYSLRAFSRDLGIAASRLSQILQNKEGISVDVAEQISDKLGLDEVAKNYFKLLVEASDSRSKNRRVEAVIKLNTIVPQEDNFTVLKEDLLMVLSADYHYTLFEMLCTCEVKHDPEWLAKRLGISVDETKASLELLQRLQLVTYRHKKYIPVSEQMTTTENVPSVVIRKFTEILLRKAISAMETQPIEERAYSTLTVGIDTNDLPKFKSVISEFRRKINKMAALSLENSAKKANEVYCLGIQFFRLTEK